ncbi:hypothetical protein FA95DRAFT_1613066 [Auriscalpium vulgare]|uniref:Uncharacterized protein n=1 Tax=Auriscalpium vulgare TaxID=40419 RepID=A0ACB8R4M7_9AGAM|nr:hypothetical protein FA95DRAFT_1613066 [Auriscalpium vulgare]
MSTRPLATALLILVFFAPGRVSRTVPESALTCQMRKNASSNVPFMSSFPTPDVAGSVQDAVRMPFTPWTLAEEADIS